MQFKGAQRSRGKGLAAINVLFLSLSDVRRYCACIKCLNCLSSNNRYFCNSGSLGEQFDVDVFFILTQNES
jgi:hypothetical protein